MVTDTNQFHWTERSAMVGKVCEITFKHYRYLHVAEMHQTVKDESKEMCKTQFMKSTTYF